MAKASDEARSFFVDLKKATTVAPIYVLHGDEAFLLRLALDEVIAKALPGGLNDFNHDMFYGKETDPHRIVAACETLVMFGGRRVVLVKECHRMTPTNLEVLANYINNPCPVTTLVCVALSQDKGLTKTTAFYRRAKKAGVVQEFKQLREWEVGTFLRKQAHARKLKLHQDAEDALVQAVGSDLASLDGALEKIDLYLGPSASVREVSQNVLSEVVAVTRTAEIFEFTDAIAQRDLVASVRLLDEMLEQGQKGTSINAMVARQMRQIWQVKVGESRGLNKNEIAQAAGMNPFFVDRYRQLARKFSTRQLRRAMVTTLETDRRLKSSRLSDRVILEQMVMTICVAPEGAAAA